MITTPLLEEKERVQRKLAEEAQYDVRKYDVRKYMENTHKIVLEAQKKYGLTLKYGDRKGGTLEPLWTQPTQNPN
ncbi:hypothetical protein BGP_6027 [Beggiatoa sp. PS]|nr:hypothetical protein BGP_6027 [Beggiatoa sp. PS]